MRAREERKIILTMSPVELRALAEEMEARWERLKPGDTTFVDFIEYSKDLTICLHLDQEYFHNLNKGG